MCDLPPSFRLDARLDPLLPPLLCQLVGLLGTLAAPAQVARQLTRDGRFMHAQVAGDGGAVRACFPQGVNLVSLLAGKLRVTQAVLLLTWWLKQHECYRSLPFTDQVQKLHLQVEFK